MTILSIRLTRKESARVARVARKRKVTRSQVVRDALATLEAPRAGTVLDAWADAVGIVDDAPRDLSTNPRHLAGLGR